MKKITFTFLLALCAFSLVQAQAKVTYLSYPTSIVLDGSVIGPADGQPAWVVQFEDVTITPTGTQSNQVFCPGWVTATAQAGIATPPWSGDVSTVAGGTSGYGSTGSIGTSTGLHSVILPELGLNGNQRVVGYADNGDGTCDFRVIHTRINSNGNAVDGTEYTLFTRHFGEETLIAVPVKADGASASGYVVAGSTYSATGTIADEAALLTAGAALGVESFSTSKLKVFYDAPRQSLMVGNDFLGDKYSIYNLMGQSVLEGTTSREISVETLKSGLYILATQKGSFKFVK